MRNLAFFISFFLFANFALATDFFKIDALDLRSGEPVHFDTNQLNKSIVLVFLSSRCPCSNSHLKELNSLAEIYKNFVFIGVHSNADEDLAQARNYFSKAALGFPVLQDNKGQLAAQFKALKTPHAFVIDEKGQVVYRGGVSDSAIASQANKFFLRNALLDLKTGHPIRTASTRTLGCVIQREQGSHWE